MPNENQSLYQTCPHCGASLNPIAASLHHCLPRSEEEAVERYVEEHAGEWEPQECHCHHEGASCKAFHKADGQTFICTEPPGHPGDHIACGLTWHAGYRWPQEPTTPPQPTDLGRELFDLATNLNRFYALSLGVRVTDRLDDHT